MVISYTSRFKCSWWCYLEVQARFDLVRQDFRDTFIKIGNDFHGKLRLYAALVDQIIERIDEREADAIDVTLLVPSSWSRT